MGRWPRPHRETMAKRKPWLRDELLVAFRLYCNTPFGKLHQHNPEIIKLASFLSRTPSAIAMKACNFASLDPVQRVRNITALAHTSRADRELWDDFHRNSEDLAAESESAYANLIGCDALAPDVDEELNFELPIGPTEVTRTIRTRRVQSFFRAAVLTSYEGRCALSDIAIPELLNASHIIPWKTNAARRADPSNGIVLNSLYDRAFDRGFITFDESLCVIVSARLKIVNNSNFQKLTLVELEGKPLRLPYRFKPDPVAMAFHRDKIFI